MPDLSYLQLQERRYRVYFNHFIQHLTLLGCAKNIDQPDADQTTQAIQLARAITTSPDFRIEKTKTEEETVSPSALEEDLAAIESNSTG